MHEILDTGKCVICCTACVSLGVVVSIAALALVLNVLKMLLF